MEPRKIAPLPDEAASSEALRSEALRPAYAPLRKNPWLAAFLSLFPGAGNIYNGLYVRGMTIFIAFVTCIYLADHASGFFGAAVAFVVIFSVIDSYRQATLINLGYSEDPATQAVRGASSTGEKLFSGVLLLGLGLLAAVNRYFPDLDLSWIFDLWPFALVAVGGWLVWSAFVARQKERGPGEDTPS